MEQNQPVSRGQRITLVVFVVVFLIPSGIGFVYKLYEFFLTLSSESEGAFALVPLMNYLLVFVGMLCLLVWAIHNGMFRDVEAPKYTMLDNERRLDEDDGVNWESGAIRR